VSRDRILITVCVLSLVGNLFAAGFFLMPLLTGPDQKLGRLVSLAGISRAPDGLMTRIDERLQADRTSMEKAFTEMRAAREAVRVEMRADPVDQARLDGAFRTLREKTSLLQEQVQISVGAAVKDAPAELRAGIRSRHADNGEGTQTKPSGSTGQ
jgi:hypothetical protein